MAKLVVLGLHLHTDPHMPSLTCETGISRHINHKFLVVAVRIHLVCCKKCVELTSSHTTAPAKACMYIHVVINIFRCIAFLPCANIVFPLVFAYIHCSFM